MMKRWRNHVENREDVFEKMPFYMTYPMQNLYLTEMEYEKDMERMKAMYPAELRQMLQMIERHCDEMEYEGSRMFDENPDRMMMEEEARRLYERFLRENPQYDVMMPSTPPPMQSPERQMPRPGAQPVPMPRPEMQMPRPGAQPEPMPRPDLEGQQYRRRRNDDPWLRRLIDVLFYDEIYRRRCRNRRCRRWW